ncbi:hypothetical protein JD77_01344 [Micromonospora olivasterospora]|uniref:Uncharacterized protein n=1 Tax=Micromonospora olivasterospora TaxID=1880 RepID=A0A562I5Z9_MICOL|nr:hypothetical protein JD77_01344 [Micromonospora olivasterospora]
MPRSRSRATSWWCCGSAYLVSPITAASVTRKPRAASHSRPGQILSPSSSSPTIAAGTAPAASMAATAAVVDPRCIASPSSSCPTTEWATSR